MARGPRKTRSKTDHLLQFAVIVIRSGTPPQLGTIPLARPHRLGTTAALNSDTSEQNDHEDARIETTGSVEHPLAYTRTKARLKLDAVANRMLQITQANSVTRYLTREAP